MYIWQVQFLRTCYLLLTGPDGNPVSFNVTGVAVLISIEVCRDRPFCFTGWMVTPNWREYVGLAKALATRAFAQQQSYKHPHP